MVTWNISHECMKCSIWHVSWLASLIYFKSSISKLHWSILLENSSSLQLKCIKQLHKKPKWVTIRGQIVDVDVLIFMTTLYVSDIHQHFVPAFIFVHAKCTLLKMNQLLYYDLLINLINKYVLVCSFSIVFCFYRIKHADVVENTLTITE